MPIDARDERADAPKPPERPRLFGRALPMAHERGRVGRFVLGALDHARTAWWGLVSPRISERRGLEIAQAVVLRGDGASREVLLTLRSDLFGWELPGGTIEVGESPEQALIREVREETGLSIEVGGVIGEWRRTGFRPHIAHLFRARATGGRLTPSHETPRVGWHPIASLPEGLLPWYRGPLAAALTEARLAEPVVEHQGIATIARAFAIDVSLRWHGLPPQGDDVTEGDALRAGRPIFPER